MSYKMKMPAQFNSMKNRQLGDELKNVIDAMLEGNIDDNEENQKAFIAMINVVVGRLKNFDAIVKQRKVEKKEAEKKQAKEKPEHWALKKRYKGSDAWKYEGATKAE